VADGVPEPHPVRCRVERWRGYATSKFFVRTPDGRLYESRAFRWWRGSEPPPSGRARAAYDELLELLRRAGWAPVATGSVWYAAELARAAPSQDGHAPGAETGRAAVSGESS
jgi:hypothetical protein